MHTHASVFKQGFFLIVGAVSARLLSLLLLLGVSLFLWVGIQEFARSVALIRASR